MDMVSIYGPDSKFNVNEHCKIELVEKPTLGYEVTVNGRTGFIPMTAVLVVKYE